MADARSLSRAKGRKKESEKRNSELPAKKKRYTASKKEGRPEITAKEITTADDKLMSNSKTYNILVPWIG